MTHFYNCTLSSASGGVKKPDTEEDNPASQREESLAKDGR